MRKLLAKFVGFLYALAVLWLLAGLAVAFVWWDSGRTLVFVDVAGVALAALMLFMGLAALAHLLNVQWKKARARVAKRDGHPDQAPGEEPSPRDLPPFSIIAIVVVWGAFGLGTLTFFLLSVPTFLAEGEGTVAAKVSHSTHLPGGKFRSGGSLEFESGAELPAHGVWDAVKVGDEIRKEKYSFAYVMNGVVRSAFWGLLWGSLRMSVMGLVFLACAIPVLKVWDTYRKKRRRPPADGK